MEDVLDVYKLPHDPKKPLVCMDESSKQQVKEVRSSIPMQPGKPERYDNEYERNGVSAIFMFFAPLDGWRHVEITDRRTAENWALQIKKLVDEYYPEAEAIRLVMDNLNTHTPVSLYKVFEPEAARQQTRNSLHTEAWQLAQHGRDRVEHSKPSVSESKNTGSGNSESRSGSLGNYS